MNTLRHDPELSAIFREMQRDHHQHRTHREQVQQHAQHHVRAAVDETRLRGRQMQENMSLAWRNSFGAWRMAAMAPAPLPGAVPGAMPMVPGGMAGPMVAAPPLIGVAPMAAPAPLVPMASMVPTAPVVPMAPTAPLVPMARPAPPPVTLNPQDGWFPEF